MTHSPREYSARFSDGRGTADKNTQRALVQSINGDKRENHVDTGIRDGAEKDGGSGEIKGRTDIIKA